MAQLTITARPIKETDERVLRPLLVHAWVSAGYPLDDLEPLMNEPYHPYNIARTLCREADNPLSPMKGWLAFVEETPAGIITTHDVDGGVYTASNFRGLGIASTLINLRNDFYRHLGIREVHARVLCTNTPSLLMHQKLGYSFNEASQALIDAATRHGIPIPKIVKENGFPVLLELSKAL